MRMLHNETHDSSEHRYFNQSDSHSRSQGQGESISFLNGFDGVTKICSFIIHVAYFLVVVWAKDFRHRSVLYVHHINFLGLVFCFNYVCWFGKVKLDYNDLMLNHVLCSITELSWAFLKCLRALSTLLLAVFRAFAVFKSDLFKIWVNSYACLLLGLVTCWMIAVALVLSAKYSFSTTYGPVYCYDGFSKNLNDAFKYFILTTLLGVVLPSALVIVIYIMTNRFLKQLEKRMNSMPKRHLDPIQTRRIIVKKLSRRHTVNAITLDQHPKLQTSEHEKRLGQFFWINFFLIISSFGFLFLNAVSIYSEFTAIWQQYRVLMRIVTEFSQSIVPVISICFHPKFRVKIQRACSKYSKKIFPTSLKDSPHVDQ